MAWQARCSQKELAYAKTFFITTGQTLKAAMLDHMPKCVPHEPTISTAQDEAAAWKPFPRPQKSAPHDRSVLTPGQPYFAGNVMSLPANDKSLLTGEEGPENHVRSVSQGGRRSC